MSEKTIKVMISQPMNGKTTQQIANERKTIADKLIKNHEGPIEVMDTTVEDHENKSSLQCFAESISFMDHADLLVMADGWQNARGCFIEHIIAMAYDKKIVYEKDLEK